MLRYKGIVAVIICLILSSCGTTRIVEIPIETVKTQYVDRVQYDSIYVDTSTETTNVRDTIYKTKIQYEYRYKYKRDTIHITDTIPKIVTVKDIQYINKLYSWQKILMYIGAISVLYLLFKVVNYKLKA